MAKRVFDFTFSLLALLLLGLPIFVCFLIASIDTRSNGLFRQIRIGQYAKPFVIYKLRTIRPESQHLSGVGKLLRKFKIDELPQLFNVIIGNMSMVGPRPDLAGYYDLLEGTDRKILELKPGITGPASLKYAKEEQILAQRSDPQRYNDEVIFPDKIRINLQYQQKQSLGLDIKIIIYTIFGKKMDADF